MSAITTLLRHRSSVSACTFLGHFAALLIWSQRNVSASSVVPAGRIVQGGRCCLREHRKGMAATISFRGKWLSIGLEQPGKDEGA
jgi:hypothetical protein